MTHRDPLGIFSLEGATSVPRRELDQHALRSTMTEACSKALQKEVRPDRRMAGDERSDGLFERSGGLEWPAPASTGIGSSSALIAGGR
jgi:hypothetical protein